MVTETNRERDTQSCILYILKHVSGGRKKIMKLMFLLDYYDINNNKLTLNKAIGNKFIVYYYGVFSKEVMDDILKLIRNGKVVESYYGKLEVNEPDKADIQNRELKKKVDAIIEKFGKSSANELETETLRMIKLTKQNKYASFGIMIDAILMNK